MPPPTFVSYAQNFEDVLLWRALRNVSDGFYIDVGASHPDLDSVTRAFHERGWRGINVEPVIADAARLAAARPRDLTLQLAVGREDGEADFFVVPGTGLSTLDPAVAQRYGDPGWNLQRGRIAVRTLASLCRAHVRGEVHFLKIDVEGAEADVLAGADLVTWRPWIILVEATAPLSVEPAHAGWEPGLIEQGYRFVWFDGLNRFYLAEERADALSQHFRTPPNVFDGFIRASDTSWAERVGSAEARASSAEQTLAQSTQQSTDALRRSEARAERGGHEVARLQQALAGERENAGGQSRALEAELSLTRHERHAARHELQQTHLRLQAALRDCDNRALELERNQAALEQNEAELDYSRQVLAGAHHQLHHTTLALDEARTWLEAVRRSTSWRLAGPLRVALRQLKRTPSEPPVPAPPPPPRPVRPMPATRTLARALPPPIQALSDQPPAGRAASPPATPAMPVLPDGFFDVLAAPPAEFPPAARHRCQVHQFHSGSAVADAVTNAMLLTRTVLRGLGYQSEIFVTHRAPELAAELRLIDELPLHDGYVLILRHSIGHESFDRIAALPAPKILIYHNITPPDLLSRHPVLAAYAALGRRQLGSLRGRVHAALADSVFNAIELHQLGFDAVRACTLLFDIDAMRARAGAATIQADAGQPDGKTVFTILFVGRICQSKGQIELIAAFNAFRAIYHLPARLVLVGRDDTDHDPYVAAVRRAVTRSAQPGEIILTGLISDAERDRWYARADLYVSLSRHEGFGVPLVEAMAHGVPVLALPSGAVPYTLGGAAILLPEDAGPGRLGAMLDALARNPARRAAHAEAQRASLNRFRLPAQTAILEQALLRAGAAMRPGQDRPALDANLHFAVAGHVNKTYSLAAVNRGLALSLEGARPGRVRLIPVEGVVTSDLSDVPERDAAAVAELARRAAPLSAPELVISQHYPVYVPPRAAGQVRLALLFWEESLLPAPTIATLEEGFDGVVAPSRFVARALQDSGLRLPVRVIPPPPALSAFRAARHAREPDSPVTFLHVSSCFPRKGADILLHAWAASFGAGDRVRLLIKSFSNPHNRVAADLAALREAHPDLAPVELIEQDMDEAALAGLYAQADVMVLPSRGEGYNLPAAEALAAGLRLIVTGAGGHMDFCDPASGAIRLLRYRHASSGSHLATPHSLWLEPDAVDLGLALREASREVPLHPPPEPPAMPASTDVAAELAGFGLDLLLQPQTGPLRLAWVTSWSQRCGVAEYSRSLLEAMEQDPAVSVTVLCDRRTPVYANLAGELPHIPCWQAGSEQVEELLQAIGRADAQAVAVQHQPGLLPWSGLVRLIDGVTEAGRVLTVTLHNSRDLLALPPARRATLLAALARVDRIIVHTLDDLNRLARLGLADRVALFPQGVRTPLPARLARALDSFDAPVIGSTGFFLPGKGIDVLIEAAVLLRGRWPGLQLRLINAAYGGAESDAEIARCRVLAGPLGDSVQFVTSFLPYQQSLEQLGACDLVVLPYRPSREASSASMRTALTSSVPVAVSRIGLFDEAGDAVLRVRAETAAELADDLETILHDVQGRDEQLRHAAAWSAAHAWPPIARRLVGLLTGLVRSGASR